MSFRNITPEMAEPHLDWLGMAQALASGHARPKGQVADVVIEQGANVMLSRHAWIEGMGAAVKTGMIFPGNRKQFGKPNLNGIVTLYDKDHGCLEATIDFGLVTKWKTAGDSLLAAQRLARPESRDILIIGAGVVARSLVEAYHTGFPDARLSLWNRSTQKAEALAREYPDIDISVVTELEAAVKTADILSTATMAHQPILKGAWLQPGQHVDLVGAYLPHMHEADGAAMSRGRIFVDSFETTVSQIGDILTPLDSGIIRREDVLADFYDLESGKFARLTEDEITIHENGGGAHLDLMAAAYILEATS